MDRTGIPHPLIAASALLAIVSATPARAATYAVDFSSPTLFDHASSTGLWDSVGGRIQAPLAANGTYPQRALDFGDGSDGAFTDGPTQAGITVSGGIIMVDTTVKDVFQFTSFTLNAGHTLQVTGSRPLTIRIQGEANVDGNIEAIGGAGDSWFGSPATVGAGRAGGGSGGEGGDETVGGGSGQSGGSSSSSLPVPAALGGGGGGNSGLNDGFEYSGGGGGCTGRDTTAGTNRDATQGAAAGAGVDATQGICGAVAANRYAEVAAGDFPITHYGLDTTMIAGAGGGGGGASTVTGELRGGASGGGGGGGIHIVALGNLDLSGTIDVQGGAGGDATFTTVNESGGAGGGGSGGVVWLQTAATLSGFGNLSFAGGAGGNSASGLNDGGAGSRGVVRLDRAVNGYGFTLSPNVGPDATHSVGVPASGPFTFDTYSRAIDFGAAGANFNSVTETVLNDGTAGCGTDGTLTLAYQGSSDGATWGSAVPAGQIAQLNGSRYLRFRASIATTAIAYAMPPCLTGLSFDYVAAPAAASDRARFELSGGLACGRTRRDGGGPGPRALLGDALCLLLALALARKSGRRSAILEQAVH
jgi:hypothetical protein